MESVVLSERYKSPRESVVAIGLNHAFRMAPLWAYAGTPLAAIGFTWIAGSLFLVAYIATRCSARPMPARIDFASARASYGAELQKQRHLLRSVWWWYLLPLFAGLATNLIVPGIVQRQPLRAALGFLAFGLLAYFIARLNRTRRRRLQEKIEALASMREEM